ncbi:MFS transporter [Pedobacter agri]|uniref:MFS transporter n=1 Tax=Pedobacter agri TaxID=454586 RepID=UPI00292DAD03|nr:MFS transporter [Pedobacter agri]
MIENNKVRVDSTASVFNNSESVPVKVKPLAQWPAVFSMAMTIIGLISAELLPISLLTPMASDLGISEASAGQAITVTAVVALFSSLFGAVLTRRIDRKVVILSFTGLLIISSLMVAVAPNYFVLISGRILLGIGLGGFWSMAAAVAMRLVPGDAVAKAFSVIFGAGTIASALAAPLGSYLGNLTGWRGTFFFVAGIATAALIWQVVSLPKLPSTGQTRIGTIITILKRPLVALGMVGILLSFGGHFVFFTYLRPFLETIPGMGINKLSMILLLFGVAGFLGNMLAGGFLGKKLSTVLAGAPLLMGVMAIGLIFFGANFFATTLLLILWGFANGMVPVAWSTWISRIIPDEAESGGALLVASIQLAITVGAAIGGLLLDSVGVVGVLIGGAATLLTAGGIVVFGLRNQSNIIIKED